jgi:hypothetical protein
MIYLEEPGLWFDSEDDQWSLDTDVELSETSYPTRQAFYKAIEDVRTAFVLHEEENTPQFAYLYSRGLI